MKATVLLSALSVVVLATPVPQPEFASVYPRGITLPLQGRKIERDVAALKRRSAPCAKNVPLDTWLRYGEDMQWYTNFTVGTPPQRLTALIDPGSAFFVFPGVQCGSSCGTHNRFDPAKSTTFSPLPGDHFDDEFGTAGTPVPISNTSYPGANVTAVTDTVCLGGLCAPDQLVYMADSYSPELNDQPMDGIFGVAYIQDPVDPAPTWWGSILNSGQVPSAEISFYAVPHQSHFSELTLGGRDPTKFHGPVTTLDLDKGSSQFYGAYIIDLPAVYIDGKKVTNKTAPGKPPLPAGSANLDYGTAAIQAPSYEAARDLYAQISPQIYEIDPLGAWGAPCDILSSLGKDIVFTLGSTGKLQRNVTLAKEDFNVGPYPGLNGICQAAVTHPGAYLAYNHFNNKPGWTFGSPVCKNYYTTYDGQNFKYTVATPIWRILDPHHRF